MKVLIDVVVLAVPIIGLFVATYIACRDKIRSQENAKEESDKKP
jgi:hypothetical protein